MFTASMRVNNVIRAYPDTLPVFQRYGIDACCGGAFELGEAARLHGLDLATLLGALEHVAGARTLGKASRIEIK